MEVVHLLSLSIWNVSKKEKCPTKAGQITRNKQSKREGFEPPPVFRLIGRGHLALLSSMVIACRSIVTLLEIHFICNLYTGVYMRKISTKVDEKEVALL